MHGSIGAEGKSRQCLDLCGDRHIGAQGYYFSPPGLQFFLRLFEGTLFDIGQYDLHPQSRARICQRTPDATRSSGHHGYLVLKLFHDIPSLFSKKHLLPEKFIELVLAGHASAPSVHRRMSRR
jgi:hypothetical protein